MSRTILVTGATGKQGGAVINALLASNADFQILAVTRDATSGSAQKLAQKSPKIKLVTGNMDDAPGIFQSASKVLAGPVWGVFSVQTAMTKSKLSESEQGIALIDAAVANNVERFVYTSVDRGGDASSTTPTNIPHFIAKHEIEQHLFAAVKSHTTLAYTILRPVAFFENLTPTFFGRVFGSAYNIALKGKPLQLIATSDIGFFAAQAFIHPEKYNNRALTIAGDELTFEQFRQVFKDKTGEELPQTYQFVAGLLLWMVKELGYMFTWFHDHGYKADLAQCRKENPGLKDFGTWLDTESDWRKK